MLNANTMCSGTDIAGTISQTCTTVYGESTSTDQTFINGFTAGEIVANVQLFLLLITAMMILYHVMFRRFKIKNP